MDRSAGSAAQLLMLLLLLLLPRLRRPFAANPSKPRPTNAQLAGSGTVLMLSITESALTRKTTLDSDDQLGEKSKCVRVLVLTSDWLNELTPPT